MLTDTRLGPADHERRAARLKVSVQGSRILSTSSQNIFPGRKFLRLEVLSARPFDQGRQAARPRGAAYTEHRKRPTQHQGTVNSHMQPLRGGPSADTRSRALT